MSDVLYDAYRDIGGGWTVGLGDPRGGASEAARAARDPTPLDLIQGRDSREYGGIAAGRISEFHQIKVRDFGGGRAEILVLDSLLIPPDTGPVWNRGKPREKELSEEERKALNLKRSARRARQVVRWRCMTLGVDRLLTLTYRENMTDLQRCHRDFRKFYLLMQRTGMLRGYVAVPERQERGAWHVHIAIAGHLPVKQVRQMWHAVVGTYEGHPNGNVDISYRKWGGKLDAKRIAAYIAKYVGKTFERELDGKTRYWGSRGIERPEVTTSSHEADWFASIRVAYALAKELGAKSIDFCFKPGSGFFWISTA